MFHPQNFDPGTFECSRPYNPPLHRGIHFCPDELVQVSKIMRKEIFLAVFQAWRKIDTELCELATRGLRVWIFVFPRAKFETEKHKHSEGMANMLMKFNFALKD